MENWLHFGINNKSIEEQYNKMLKLSFPQAPDEDLLYDLYSELVEMDGYIMGAISAYLKKGKTNFNSLVCDAEFMQIFAQISIQSEELKEILQYKWELDKLVMLFEKQRDK